MDPRIREDDEHGWIPAFAGMTSNLVILLARPGFIIWFFVGPKSGRS